MYSDDQQGEDEWASFQQTEYIPASIDPIIEYQMAMGTVPSIDIGSVAVQVLRHHRITITHSSNISSFFNVYKRDCYMAMKKKQHYGTHCVYDVVLANFILQIHLLNIHRSSDERDSSLSQSQLGAGGFGTVRKAKIGQNIFAIKRINFMTKAQGIDGFDIQTENAERRQIQSAIREYCLYKICSMLKIGPQVIFGNNYDLVCFNNCIEFTMELCQIPSKEADFMAKRNLTLEKLERDLTQNLKVLHSLQIVHRDIKPDNVVYSQSQQKFVFTDFGLTHAINQGLKEKTATYFGGTVGYCSEELMALLSGQMGMVNLYLNDFVGLRKTVSNFQVYSSKSSSLSRNGLSYKSDNGECSFEKMNEIEEELSDEWFESQLSSTSLKDSDNIYIKSTHWLDAPFKSASQINYYQSVVLYNIFKEYQTNLTPITPPQINAFIQRYCLDINDNFVYQQVKKYVISIFYPSDHACQLTLKVVELKNTARCFGAKSEETLSRIDNILASKELWNDSEIVEYFRKLKDSIVNDKEIFEMSKFSKEMSIHLYLKNYSYFVGCCLRILRQAVRYKMSSQLKFIDLTFICRLYIICNCLNIANCSQIPILNDFFIELWEEGEFDDLQQMRGQKRGMKGAVNNRLANRLIRHAVEYIIKSKRGSSFDILQAFLFYLTRFSWSNSEDYIFYHNHLARIESLKENDEGYRESLKVELVKVYRRILILSPDKETVFGPTMEKMKRIIEGFKNQQDKKYYFACLSQEISLYSSIKYSGKLQDVKTSLQDLQRYQCPKVEKYSSLVSISKAIGDILLHRREFEEGIKYLRKASQYIIQFYGMRNVSWTYYECCCNISYAYYQQNEFKKALQNYQYAQKFIQSTNMITDTKSLVYRAILSTHLQIGITKEDYPQISQYLRKIVDETVITLISKTTSDSELNQYVLDMRIFNFIEKIEILEHKIFVMKTLLKYIERHLSFFIFPYEKINYQLNKIYVQVLKQPLKGMVYIWNYISLKLKGFYGVTREDFQLMNNFVLNLIKNQSVRRALILIRKYIFHIPLSYFQQRKTAFKLFSKIHTHLDHPFSKVTHQLAARDCEALSNHDFSRILRQEEREGERLMNLMLSKWLRRV